jgi:glutamate-ammonia-ligase adenylyltransferase
MTRVIESAIQSAADPARARHGFRHVPGAASISDSEQARILAALFSASPAMTALLEKHPGWVQSVLVPENLAYPRQEQGLRREANGFLQPALQARDYAGAFSRLRQFQQREMLRIAARDLGRLGNTQQVIREISNVADVCLAATLQLCQKQLVERLGQPYHQDADGRWQPTEFCVLGLGKLGGQELNYSSDVDVIFVYTDEGGIFKAPPRDNAPAGSAMPNHSFFKRLAESFVAEVGRATEDGALYRIDLRLRPEGDAGPFARSLASYENFYAQWGQTWERMMLIKARCVAGDAGLAAEFLEMVQSFRYPRSLSEGALREIAAMKARTEKEVIRPGELERDVKRGRGGIREIEFVVQTAQILHAGRIPFLQGAQTLPLLQKLAQYKLLAEAEARELARAYCFLRDVEHRLQMEHNLQTHTLPADAPARARLAALMGFAGRADFEAALRRHTQFVRETYEKFVKAEESGAPSPFPARFRGDESEWKKVLAAHSFLDPDHAFKLLEEFAHGPAYAHTSQRTTELAMGLAERILTLCPKQNSGGDVHSPTPTLTHESVVSEGSEEMSKSKSRSRSKSRSKNKDLDCSPNLTAANRESAQSAILSDPDRVLARLDSFISAYGARATLFEAWTHNPQLFELLLLLFDRSEFLAEVAIRTPDLVDELVLSGRLRRRKSAEEILSELRHGADDADQRLWLRRYHQAEFMRIGLRDILGLADYELNFIELSALADACLHYTLEAVARAQRLKPSPVAIVGLGKLGGRELNYGSDLDIVFVAADKAKARLPRLQDFAAQVMEMLSSQTELGIAFVTDARLRPDGEKGLLVNTLEAHEEYYRRRAHLWEIQALTRVRAIAGDLKLGEQFERLAATLTDFRGLDSARPPHPGPLPLGGGEGGAPAAGKRSAELPLGTKLSRARDAPSRSSALRWPACLTLGWKKEIARIRARIEKERTPAGQDALAFKTGRGGLIDAEFIAQSMCLEHGWQEPNTLRALQRIRDEGALPHADAEKLIENYRQLRRVESILRRWSFEGEAVLPDDAPAFYRVSVRCGFATPAAFREAVAAWRNGIREVYRAVFPV